jgi:hypothetical protein
MREKIIVSRKGFHCDFCNQKKVGAYRIIDGAKSCEKCNRAYDYVAPKKVVECPLCQGKGYLE